MKFATIFDKQTNRQTDRQTDSISLPVFSSAFQLNIDKTQRYEIDRRF